MLTRTFLSKMGYMYCFLQDSGELYFHSGPCRLSAPSSALPWCSSLRGTLRSSRSSSERASTSTSSLWVRRKSGETAFEDSVFPPPGWISDRMQWKPVFSYWSCKSGKNLVMTVLWRNKRINWEIEQLLKFISAIFENKETEKDEPWRITGRLLIKKKEKEIMFLQGQIVIYVYPRRKTVRLTSSYELRSGSHSDRKKVLSFSGLLFWVWRRNKTILVIGDPSCWFWQRPQRYPFWLLLICMTALISEKSTWLHWHFEIVWRIHAWETSRRSPMLLFSKIFSLFNSTLQFI